MQQMHLDSRELLTARQVQQMLHIDRSTVYRMAGDGRLSAVRVGKQLRFPADRIGKLLHGHDTHASDGLDRRMAAGAIAVAADLLGVTMVVTDMSGQPLTAIANPCPWFVAHRDDEVLRSCLEDWRVLADDPDLAPRFALSAPGFECARALVRSGPTLIAMVLAGGIAPREDHSSDDFHQLDQAQRDEVLRALPRIAAVLGSRALATELPEVEDPE